MEEKFHVFHVLCDNRETFTLATSVSTVNSTIVSTPL